MESGETPTKTVFVLEGKEYPVPSIDTLDMDECRVMFDYCGLVQEDFVPLEDETEDETADRNAASMKHPGFWTSLMHIAYQRGNPKLPAGRVRDVVGKTNKLDALARFADELEEDDAGPPALTSAPAESSPRSSDDSSASSGSDSTTPSAAEPEATPAPIGATRSVTSSPRSAPTTSAA